MTELVKALKVNTFLRETLTFQILSNSPEHQISGGAIFLLDNDDCSLYYSYSSL